MSLSRLKIFPCFFPFINIRIVKGLCWNRDGGVLLKTTKCELYFYDLYRYTDTTAIRSPWEVPPVTLQYLFYPQFYILLSVYTHMYITWSPLCQKQPTDAISDWICCRMCVARQICISHSEYQSDQGKVKKPLLKGLLKFKNVSFMNLWLPHLLSNHFRIQKLHLKSNLFLVVLFVHQILSCLHFGIGLVGHTWLHQAPRRAHSSSRPHSLPLWKGSHALYSQRSQRCQKYRHAFTWRRLCQSFLPLS